MYSPNPREAKALGRLIRSFRREAKLSLGECAARIDCTRSTLSRFENGERIIAADTLARFSRVIADEIAKRRNSDAA